MIPLQDGNIGAPCEKEEDCNQSVCLTPETARTKFLMEGDAEFEIPGGYCTTDLCSPGGELCPQSEGGYCWSLEPIMGVPGIGMCFRECNSVEDCAPDGDQVCAGKEDFGFYQYEIDEYYADAGKMCIPHDFYQVMVDEVAYIHSWDK